MSLTAGLSTQSRPHTLADEVVVGVVLVVEVIFTVGVVVVIVVVGFVVALAVGLEHAPAAIHTRLWRT